MENKSKKIIIIITVLLIILFSIIIGIVILMKKTINNNETLDEIEYFENGPINTSLEKVSLKNDYNTVKNILKKYYSALSGINKKADDILIYEYEGDIENIEKEAEKELEEEIKNNKDMVYSFFEESCINEIGLTTDNIQEKLGNYKDAYFLIDKLYKREISEILNVYFVNGKIIEKETSQVENFVFMITVDSQNNTFNIYTESYIKKHNLYELSKKEDFKENYYNINIVENRKYNKFKFEIISEENYAKELLNTFTQSIKYNIIEYSYNRLHENYKEDRFRNISDYEEYIKNKKESIIKANLKSYKINKYDDYKQYICLDYAGNYYIFNEYSIMEYTLILDTYTVDIPEVVEKYNKATDQEKVGTNIEKVLEAIENGDYKYVYSKLDNTFKQNKFPTENDLQKYLQNNFSEDNDIEYLSFSEEGDVYVYQTKINDKRFNIIVQLGEGTEFVMSFSFEE